MNASSDVPDSVRHLVVVLGDQLSANSNALKDFDASTDVIWMAEVAEESEHVWSTKSRIVMFLSAMRHFAEEMRENKRRVIYRALDDKDNRQILRDELICAIKSIKPRKVITIEPGSYRIHEMLLDVAEQAGAELEIRRDDSFLCSAEEFEQHAAGRKGLRQEFFYREMRKRLGVLVDGDGKPEGGDWNYDSENRQSLPKSGPGKIKSPRSFRTDEITEQVIRLVNKRFADHPGTLDDFDYPVTHKQARRALRDFLKHRLKKFGDYQDAMWTDKPWLYHSRLSATMNLKLLDPRDVVDAAVRAYRERQASLNNVEGFIRQIIGWREYVRGVYWHFMPQYIDRNTLGAQRDLPDFYWNGQTDAECLRQCITQTLRYGYAHHIQRLMVTGLFAMLYGVNPREVHKWYLAVYVDAVEWVELPNTLGMSQFADDGVMASKPYAASGKYIDRMSNYCKSCRYDPAIKCGDDACPFTTLYWDFLRRHEKRLRKNARMNMQLRNLKRLSDSDRRDIRKWADKLR